MKKLLVTAGAVTAACLLAPKVISTKYEPNYHELLDKFAQYPNVTIDKREISTGWFSGTSTTNILVSPSGLKDDEFEIIVKESSSFGPLIFTDGFKVAAAYSQINFNRPKNAETNEFLTQLKEASSFTSTTSLTGEIVSNISVNAIEIEENGVKITSKGLTSEITIENERTVSGTLNWEGFKADMPTVDVTLDSLSSSFVQFTLGGSIFDADALLLGKSDMLIQTFEFVDKTSEAVFSLTNTSMFSDTEIEDNLLTLNLKNNIDEVVSPTGKFNQVNLNMAFTNLDVESTTNLYTAMNKLPPATSPDFAKASEEIVPKALKLLDFNPEFQITQLSMVTAQGPVNSDAVFSLNKDLIDVKNPNSIVLAAKGVAKAKVPVAFLAQFGMQPMIDAYQQNGFVTIEEENVNFDVLYEKGQLSLNGKPLQM